MAQTQDLTRLVVSLEAKLNAFDKAMARASKTADSTAGKIERRFRAAETNLSQFGRGIGLNLRGLAAGLGIGAIANFARTAVKHLAELGDAAKRAGVNVEDLQAAIFAARQEGGNADALVAGFAKLNHQLGEGVQKGNDLSKILKANGITIGALAGDPVKALMTIADLMQRANNEQDRAVLGVAAFGRDYKELLPFLMQGSQVIEKTMQDARDLGAVVGSDLVAQAKKFDDAWTLAWDVFEAQSKGAVVRAGTRLENLYRVLRGDSLTPGHGTFTTPLEDMRFEGDVKQHHPKIRGPATIIPHEATDEEKAFQKEAARLARESAKEKRELAKATDMLWAATKREIDELQIEASSAGKSIYEIERLKKARELIAKLEDEHRQHGGSVTDQEARNANALADAYGHMAQAVADQKNELQQLRDVGDTVFGDLETSLDNFIDTGKLSFKSLVESIIKDLAKLAVHNTLQLVMNGQPGTGQTGLMGLFASAFGIGTPPASTAGVLTGTPGVSRNPYETQRGHGFIPPGADQIIQQLPLGPVSSAVRVGAAGPAAQWGPFTKDIHAAASKYGLDPNDLAALIQHESGFDPTADAHKNFPGSHAFGLTQLQPGTARAMGVTDIHDPTQQIYGGARYLSEQIKKFGDVRTGLAAYNQGPGTIARVGINGPGGDYANDIIAQSAKYAQAVTTTAQNAAKAATQSNVIPSAVSQIAQSLGSAGGSGGGGGILSLLTGAFGIGGAGGGSGLSGARAAGGPVMAGGRYLVGERGPELFMPRIPGVIVARGGGNGSGGGFQVHVTPSKYFDVHVSRIASQGDARTLDTARRQYPETSDRYRKLGTT